MRIAPIALALGAAVTLSACGTSHLNRSTYSVHQPEVVRSAYIIDLNIDPMSGLPGPEVRRLDEWFGVLDLGYGDRVAVDYGGGYGNAAATNMISKVAARRGLLLTDAAPVTGQAMAPGTVRVVVQRTTASVPGCPDWSKKSESEFGGALHSNYGCAINSNLAAMVADPEDLVRGRSSDGENTNQSNKAIDAYHQKKAKAGEVQSIGRSGGGSGGQ